MAGMDLKVEEGKVVAYTSYRHKVTFSETLEFQREQGIKLLLMCRVGLI